MREATIHEVPRGPKNLPPPDAPADRSTTPLTCVACHHDNGPDRKFCRSCGESLWRKCLKCATECPLNDLFCGNCGANQQQLISEQLQTLEAAMCEATRLRTLGKLAPAIRLLGSVPDVEHAAIRPRLLEVRRLADALIAERDRSQEDGDIAVSQAERWLEERKYPQALQRLQLIPVAFRNERVQKALRTAESACLEIRSLRAKIAQDVDARRLTQLAPAIDRYLDLQPEDEKVRTLAARVRDSLAEKARAAVATAEFEQAGKLLECIPLASLDEAVARLKTEVREVNRLQSELRQAPHADAGLLTIATRLTQLAPQHGKFQALLANLKTRIDRAPPHRRSPQIPWAATKSSSYLGVQVEWLGGYSSFTPATADVDKILRRHDGEWFVALGLALQGLGRAEISINLVPKEESTGLLGKLSRLRKLSATRTAWGLDVGHSCLKVIQLRPAERSGEGPVIVAAERIPYPVNLAIPDAEKKRVELIREALRTWRDRYRPTDEDALCVSCPGSKTLSRFFSIPRIASGKQDALVAYEAGQQIPFPLADLSWGYQLLPQAETQDLAILTAMRRSDARDQIQPFHDLELRVQTLQVEASALHNYAAFDGLPACSNDGTAETSGETALLELGAESSHLVITAPKFVWSRSLRSGGNDVSFAAARTFRLTFAQAEETKRSLSPAQPLGEWLRLFDQNLSRLVSEIQRSLDAFHQEHPGRRVTRIMLCGGGARQFGLLRHLRSGPLRDAGL